MDEAEFDAFYAASFHPLVGQIYGMCGNLAEAQDCVQEAFIRAWDKRKQLEQARSPEAWVRTTAYRLSVSRWCRATHAFRARDRSLATPTPAEPNPTRVAINRALDHLTLEQRQAVVLFYMADLSIAEIAAEVGVPEGTIKARLSRGRTALAGLLSDDKEVENAS